MLGKKTKVCQKTITMIKVIFEMLEEDTSQVNETKELHYLEYNQGTTDGNLLHYVT